MLNYALIFLKNFDFCGEKDINRVAVRRVDWTKGTYDPQINLFQSSQW
jgi:hypothetical protein